MPGSTVTAESLDAKQLLGTLVALKKGDFSARLPVEWTGTAGKIADTFNDVVELNETMIRERERVSRAVGKEGKITQRASLGNVGGSWATLVESINLLIDNLVQPTSEMARVIGAVAEGDLSQNDGAGDRRPAAARASSCASANTVNTMVDQLELLRRGGHPRGPRGRHRGQARRPGRGQGVAGTWKDLTDSVNSMAGNLTGQVRNIAEVTTAVANGDLSKKITVDVRGEILELKNTINTMVDQLNSFASRGHPRRPRGRHRGQARRPGRGQGRGRHLEGPHRQRQLDGRQPDRPGAQHRRGHHRRRQRRPLQEDHRRRQGRDPRAEEHHQHDGRPAQLLRLGGHARGPRGRHRGQARRPGAR